MTTRTGIAYHSAPLAALVLALSLAACGAPAAPPAASGDTATLRPTAASQSEPTAMPTATARPTEAPRPTVTPEPTATPKPAEAGSSRSNPLPLGTEVRLKTWAVTITTVTRGKEAQQAIAAANQFNDPPREGHAYLLASLRLENISDKQEAQHVAFGASLRVTGDRNVLYAPVSVVEPKPLEGELFPGGQVEGQIAFEVPADEQNLMFQVTETFAFDDTPRFIAIDTAARIAPDAALADIQPTGIGTRRNAPAKPGETLATGEWELTLLEVVRGKDAAKLVQQANEFNEPAPAGSEYVAVKLRVRSTGIDKPDVAQHIDGGFLKISGEQNVVYEKPSVVAPEPELDAYLFPGGSAEGWEILSVAAGEQKLALIFKPLFSFSDDQTRFLAIE
jgi:hypothetical protein